MAERESVYLWSTTALSNGSADTGINWSENQLPSTVNNAARGMMAGIARWLKDTDGSLTTGGSANSYTLTINGTQTAYASGQRYTFKASFSNTGASTLNITNADATAIGAKAIRVFTAAGEIALAANMIISGSRYDLIYDSSANGAAGGFILLNPTTSLGASTDNAAVRFDGTVGLTQTSALIIDDTTARLSRSGNGGVPVQGTNTNDSASAGDKGEVISSSVASGSAVSLTNNTAANMTSISLTAGDWDVYSNIIFLTTGTTNYNYFVNTISTTSNTLGSGGGQYSAVTFPTAGITNSNLTNIGTWCGPYRASISSTTTHYSVGQAGFSASTVGIFGLLYARRIR